MIIDFEKIIDVLRGKELVKRGKWHQSVILHEIYGEGEATSFQQKLGYQFIRSLEIIYKDNFYDLKAEVEKASQIIEQEYNKNRQYLLNYAEDCESRGWKLLEYANKFRFKDYSSIKNEELIENYKDLISSCKNYMPFMFSLHRFDEFLTNKFENLLKKFADQHQLSKQDFFDYQNALTLPSRKIFVLEEKEAFLKIIASIQQKQLDPDQIDKQIEKHVDKYGWMSIPNLEALPQNKEYYLQKIKEANFDASAELEKLQIEDKILRTKQQKIMEDLDSDSGLKYISQVIQKFGFLRSFRVDALYISLFNGWKIFEEVAKRLNITIFDATYLSTDEAIESLFGKLDYLELINERKSNMLSIMIEDRRYELSGADIDKVLPFINFPEIETRDSVKGTTAFPGKVTGRCKVFLNMENLAKINPGEILVVSMTDPNYLPAMEKAVAFITDQGGILCHAAIIAREMKKPCIIGTKIATKVLKDGDLIEVDANRGIVKKV